MFFPGPGSTVHSIYDFSPPPNPGQNADQKCGRKAGQKVSQKYRGNLISGGEDCDSIHFLVHHLCEIPFSLGSLMHNSFPPCLLFLILPTMASGHWYENVDGCESFPAACADSLCGSLCRILCGSLCGIFGGLRGPGWSCGI